MEKNPPRSPGPQYPQIRRNLHEGIGKNKPRPEPTARRRFSRPSYRRATAGPAGERKPGVVVPSRNKKSDSVSGKTHSPEAFVKFVSRRDEFVGRRLRNSQFGTPAGISTRHQRLFSVCGSGVLFRRRIDGAGPRVPLPSQRYRRGPRDKNFMLPGHGHGRRCPSGEFKDAHA